MKGFGDGAEFIQIFQITSCYPVGKFGAVERLYEPGGKDNIAGL
jgi:hypothetical protein